MPIQCSVARHPSYRRLAGLLPLLRQAEPRAWRAVVATFVYPSYRRRGWCSRCGAIVPPEYIGQVHRHGRRAVAVQARMIRVPLYPVEQADVERAIRWLDEHWTGTVSSPMSSGTWRPSRDAAPLPFHCHFIAISRPGGSREGDGSAGFGMPARMAGSRGVAQPG